MRVPSTDGVELEVLDLGGDGPPLLIAHANGFCAGAYTPLAPTFARDFHVFAVDLRAHGASTSTDTGELDWGGMTDDVLATVAAIGGGPVRGFGHSLGGAALLGAEARVPGTLAAAWVFEPIVVPTKWGERAPGDNPMAAAARRRRASFPSKAEALARYAAKPPLGLLRADALAAYVEYGFTELPDGTVTLSCTPEDEARVFEAAGKVTVAHVAHVSVPLVVASGQRDPIGPQAFAPEVAAAVPGATLRTYAHLGHFGPLQDPTTIAEDAAAFFLEPSGPS